MNKLTLSFAAVCSLFLSLAPAGFAAPKDYQVTGPIVSMTDTTIVVLKGKENWELSKDAALKPADGSALKVGDKVTLHYTMTATTVEAKPAAHEKKPPTDKAAAKKDKAAATPAPAASAAPAATPAPAMAH